MRVLVTRPREDAAGLVAALEARGHEALLEPLLTITLRDKVDWPAGQQAAQALPELLERLDVQFETAAPTFDEDAHRGRFDALTDEGFALEMGMTLEQLHQSM